MAERVDPKKLHRQNQEDRIERGKPYARGGCFLIQGRNSSMVPREINPIPDRIELSKGTFLIFGANYKTLKQVCQNEVPPYRPLAKPAFFEVAKTRSGQPLRISVHVAENNRQELFFVLFNDDEVELKSFPTQNNEHVPPGSYFASSEKIIGEAVK